MLKLDESYFNSLTEEIRRLSSGSKPSWGSMSPQHMVEHLVSSWRISNGRSTAKVISSEEYREKAIKFLFSELPFEKNIKNPIHSKGLPPLRKESLEASIDQLANEINTFFEFWGSKGEHKETHPLFGELDKHGWLTFQKKHMIHHLKQFGLSAE